jgi:hypothetical protein
MKTLLRAAGALAVASASLVVTAPGASALSCVEPSSFFPDVEHVFVGRIADVQGDRMMFEVQEVWQGEDLPRDLWVPMRLEMWFPFSTNGDIPDGYSSPRRYVVAVDADLAVSPCSLAPDDGSRYGVDEGLPRPPFWDAASSGAEGQDVSDPVSGPVSQGPSGSGASTAESAPAPLVAGGAGAMGVAAVLTALWRRRSR